jgi:uncharacterized protein YehS (DUF1456 family)
MPLRRKARTRDFRACEDVIVRRFMRGVCSG